MTYITSTPSPQNDSITNSTQEAKHNDFPLLACDYNDCIHLTEIQVARLIILTFFCGILFGTCFGLTLNEINEISGCQL
ncbi:MAG: hypothetical protein K0R52_437 [Alphaproteobacteria bacterium]|nr:hypothetical protein [Alphaproteobacteria bacterium]